MRIVMLLVNALVFGVVAVASLNTYICGNEALAAALPPHSTEMAVSAGITLALVVGNLYAAIRGK